MFYSISLILFFLASIVLGQPTATTAQAVPTVVLNELMWMGSSVSAADEWIELRNTTDQVVDMSGWKLTKKSSGAEVPMLTIPSGSFIAAGGYFLLSNYADTNASSALAVPPSIVDADVALVNTALLLKLYDPANVLVDTADDGSGNPLAGRLVSADQVFWSMERNVAPGDGTLPENWHTASRSIGFDDGRSERGTPGAANSNGLPVATAGPALAGVVGQAVNFDASESSDPEQQPLTFSWNFGDESTGSGSAPSHVYAAAGEFTATVVVSDGLGSVIATVPVTISPAPAAAVSTSPHPSSKDEGGTSVSIKPKTSCRGLQVSEIFPNPAGIDETEFIELVNPTTKSLSLTGCSVWLNDKRRYVFPELVLIPKQFFVLEKSVSKLSLTNTGGALRLDDTDGSMLATLEYPKAPDNESWCLLGSKWSWTNRATPGAVNLEPVDDDEVVETATTATADEKTILSVAPADVQTLESGQIVRVQGVVTVMADTLASRTVWFQDDTAGLQALLAEESLRPVIGDLIEMIGTVRSFQGRKRLSVKAGDIKVVASGRAVEPKHLTLDQVTPDVADVLVMVEGLISSTTSAKILIDDGSAEGEVYLKSSTGIVKPKMSSGDRIMITGIVSVTTAGVRILPRATADIRVERVLGTTTTNSVPVVPLQTSPPQQTWWYWGLVILGGCLAMLKPAWRWWRSRENDRTSKISG